MARINLVLATAAVLVLLPIRIACAEIVVVVDARSPIQSLSQNDVVNIFMGRYRLFPGGELAFPVDQPKGSDVRNEFYRLLIGKSPSEISAYWARLHFSGAARQPAQAGDVADVLTHVLGTRGGIAYLDRSRVDSRVRIVLPLAN